MILGLGVDLCEVERVSREIVRAGDGLLRDLFSDLEIADCERQRRPAAHFAARFAAKEAVLKAFAVDGREGLLFRSVEIGAVAADGRRDVVLRGRLAELAASRGVACVHLSTAHTRALAGASAILESAGPDSNASSEVRR